MSYSLLPQAGEGQGMRGVQQAMSMMEISK